MAVTGEGYAPLPQTQELSIDMADQVTAPRDVFLVVLAAARDAGHRMSRTKVAKLLYLCDLRAVKTGDEPFTGVDWRWLHHGPFSNTLLRLEDELVDERLVAREQRQNFFGTPEYVLSYAGWHTPALEDDHARLIQEVVRQYGGLAASTLRDVTYQTEPMQHAQRQERGVRLNLDTARSVPDIAPALARLRKVRNRLPDEDTEPGAFDDMREEMASLERTRREANTRLLGD